MLLISPLIEELCKGKTRMVTLEVIGGVAVVKVKLISFLRFIAVSFVHVLSPLGISSPFYVIERKTLMLSLRKTLLIKGLFLAVLELHSVY